MKRRTAMIALVIAAAVLTVWTGTAFSKSKKKGGKQSISFKDEKGSLIIENQLDADAVIFAGRTERQIILGGIKAGSSRSFDLRKLPEIPARGTFAIRAVKAAAMNKPHITAEDVIYTALVTYDVTDENDVSRIIIPSVIDASQQFCVYASNESFNCVLELRINDPVHGECIATVLPFEINKRIYLAPRDDGRDYHLYPTFVFINPNTGEKASHNGGRGDVRRVSPEPLGGASVPICFVGPAEPNIKYDVAFVSLQNGADTGLIFQNGVNALKNQKGIRFTDVGRTDVYEIPVENSSGEQLYGALSLVLDDSPQMSISPYKFKAGYKYDVIVTQVNGNYQYDIREAGQKRFMEDARISLLFE